MKKEGHRAQELGSRYVQSLGCGDGQQLHLKVRPEELGAGVEKEMW